MNNRVLILFGGLIAGGALVYLLPKSTGDSGGTAKQGPTVAAPTPAPAVAADTKKSAVPAATKSSTAPTGAWAKLAEKYGAEKTKLSQKISSDLGDVIDQGMELANTMAKSTGADSPAEAASKEALRNMVPQLGLNEDQQAKASELINGAVNERMEAVTALASAMRSDPEAMMEMFLAGDALSSGDMAQAEYDQITQPTRTMLTNMGGFLMGRPGAGPGGQLFGDPAFTEQLNAILTPDQQAKLAEMSAQFAERGQAAAGAGGGGAGRLGGLSAFQNGQIPVMSLDKLDQSVGSVKKLAGAAQVMMEAMKGLKDANTTVPK